ncbi:MAG: tryptophan 7-halogenase, partial [Deltaproteobacteria bacterium]|nr:tryptophan 7-halogenase [Deltaproteobacteria bacterium]
MLDTQPLEASGAFARPFRPRRVGIVGGGTAGLLTALALKEWQPELEVTLLESSKIPVIGVGEATTPPIVPFLFGYLGIDPHQFERAVAPTWKLGIRFEWGAPEPWYFNYAFGDGDLADAQRHDGHPNRYAMTSMLMSADKGPVAKVGGKLIPLLNETRFALHLDNERLVAFLHARARAVGVTLVDATLGDVEVERGHGSQRHIKRALFDIDGTSQALSFDLWVDCTGFRSLLLGKALEVPFESYADALFTDTAVTCVRDNGGQPRPYTTATT